MNLIPGPLGMPRIYCGDLFVVILFTSHGGLPSPSNRYLCFSSRNGIYDQQNPDQLDSSSRSTLTHVTTYLLPHGEVRKEIMGATVLDYGTRSILSVM